MQMFVEKKAADQRNFPLVRLVPQLIFGIFAASARKKRFNPGIFHQPGDQVKRMVRRSGPFVVAV